ncbi:hypothetical protein ACVWXE_002259, partial [Thermostichus sp. MS-CIW-41]
MKKKAVTTLVALSLGAACLGCVDLSFEPKESTDEIEKTQEVPGQFVKTR